MTHLSVPREQRAILGIDDNFIRLSVGLENADDLIADIEQALLKSVKLEWNFLIKKNFRKFNKFIV